MTLEEQFNLLMDSIHHTISAYVQTYGMPPRCLYMGTEERYIFKAFFTGVGPMHYDSITILPMKSAGVMARLE